MADVSVAPSSESVRRPSIPARGSVSAASLANYRAWVNQHRIGAAALAGLVATQVANLFGYAMPSFGLTQLNWSFVNGSTLVAPDIAPGVQLGAGAAFHYADGVAFAILFAIAVRPVLPFRFTPRGNMLSGLLLGTVLATISAIWMGPRVYYPDGNLGFFSSNLGWEYIAAVYLFHWVYGLHLGLIYNPTDPRESQGDSDLARA